MIYKVVECYWYCFGIPVFIAFSVYDYYYFHFCISPFAMFAPKLYGILFCEAPCNLVLAL